VGKFFFTGRKYRRLLPHSKSPIFLWTGIAPIQNLSRPQYFLKLADLCLGYWTILPSESHLLEIKLAHSDNSDGFLFFPHSKNHRKFSIPNFVSGFWKSWHLILEPKKIHRGSHHYSLILGVGISVKILQKNSTLVFPTSTTHWIFNSYCLSLGLLQQWFYI
jgi:hypothetical protein